jgi:NADH-quinone oxidoreductase subunit K
MAQLSHLSLNHFLVVGALLFAFGILAVVTRRNAVAVLMGIELILNAANLNLVAFGRYVAGGISGQIFGLFVIVLAAAEAAVGLAIILAIYQMVRHIDTAQTTTLKE